MLYSYLVNAVLFYGVAFAAPGANLKDFVQPTICAAGEIGVGQQTDQYSGTYAVIYDSNCAQYDFTSSNVSNICGRYSFGSEVTCQGSTVTSAATSLTGAEDGTQLTTFGSCRPAPAGSNCNDAFGLTLDTTFSWCCAQA
ncbi:hypothetical protein K439DRAFT_1614734 [Ramaria rubella]|nr:hypothetical protein K439DRAFT_1614734 [Ramaria rubella]